MKKRRKWIIICTLALLPVLFNAVIMSVNNRIADRLEKRMLDYPLPPDTEIVDSISVAKKLYGNGNGMQYFGGILVGSDLSEEELYTHYEDCADGIDGYVFVEVVPQESQIAFEYHDYWFDAWQIDRPSYRVGIWIMSTAGLENSLTEAVLNMDLRGH